MLALKKSLIALALGFAGVAQAGTYNLGTLGPTPIFGNVMQSAGSFSDIFNFSIASPHTVAAGTIMDVPMAFDAQSWFNIDDLTATLFDGFGATGTPLGMLSGDYITQSGVLPVGDYSVQITGSANGMYGGTYTYTAFAQAVPEPETYAMFLAGLGLIGFIARQRKAQTV